MQDEDREPIATIALIAAMADGDRGPEEVAQLNQIATELGGADFDRIARQVLAGQVKIQTAAARLTSADARRKAYELAVAVCHADGAASEREKAFLADLKQELGLDAAAALPVESAAQEVAQVGVAGPAAGSAPSDGTDDTILKNAMLAGALELLPQGLATMAIIPLQLRLVYRIGADAGQRLDAAQVKDLAGVLGIGAAGQVMEGFARRLLGGVLGRALGGAAGGVAGVGVTFATTYALGHAAKQYYAQGRNLSRDDLRALFARLKDEAKTIFPRVEGQIREQAAHLNLPAVLQRFRA